MKNSKLFLCTTILMLLLSVMSFSQVTKEYYLPEGISYNSDIPAPEEFLGYSVGEWHVSHDLLVGYFKLLAEKSPRIKYETYGKTHEGRPLTIAIISSEENIKNLDAIKKIHKQITDPATSSSVDLATQPVVVWLSHSIHGNEASGANSALLTAYYYTAGTGKEIEDILKNTIILIDPTTNPDGLQRFSTWVNSHKSYQGNSDPLSREHLETWPGGRSNHYWFDLNRDWLLIEQPESEYRVKKLLEWKPNILVDLHEMGSNSTFHFSPGEPKRVNPLIPEENQTLTKKLAADYAKAYDEIGSFYFSSEQFDDYYIGRGPTFMDMNGGVALLFEQASSRGFAQNTVNGLLTFPFAIRNQFTGSVSTVNTASRLRNEFLTYQKNYYSTAITDAKKSSKKAYIFGSVTDRSTTFRLAHFLSIHGINSYLIKKDLTTSKNIFKATCAYVVPLEQPQFRLIESIFETRTAFSDSLFYDVSAWNIPMAYNVPFESLDVKNFTTDLQGEVFSPSQQPAGSYIGAGSAYAYVIKWDDYYAPAALYTLLKNNVIVKVATSPIETLTGDKYERGSLVIPMGNINSDAGRVEEVLKEIITENGLNVYRLNTGDNEKIDLGSPTLVSIDAPKILVMTEDGVSGFSAGQLWHLFDTRYKIPVTLLPQRLLSSVNLFNYNILIVPDGNYQAIGERTIEKIKAWLSSGNTVIGLERAAIWLNKNKFISVEFSSAAPASINLNYESTLISAASREVPGTVFEAFLDLTHPMNYGYSKDRVAIYKDNDIIQTTDDQSPLSFPARFTSASLLSGYSPRGFEKTLAGSPVYSAFPFRQGRVVVFYNNPNFRGYWWGTNKFLANAIFFSKAIRFSSSRIQ
ncbi:MAG: M14 family zinc carboxypeptidase [Bacteroidales bacterium]|nr:M14 family zinc carboxypeptidase [Bacteroidales bacterium]MDT8373072.1 M14 family zinc carboxypeptidase [Bacteroidales bacterium]